MIDSDVCSSGEWLAAVLAANELGVFVGEPTGGGGSVPGDTLVIELPNTKLTVCVSHKFFYKPSMRGYDYPGVLPDYWVPRHWPTTGLAVTPFLSSSQIRQVASREVTEQAYRAGAGAVNQEAAQKAPEVGLRAVTPPAARVFSSLPDLDQTKAPFTSS